MLLLAGLQLENVVFDPTIVMITIGPWLAGLIAASRTRLTRQLQARNAELAAEQERFAAESVRLERARVAGELHDVVAHCLALIVVQAGAGQRSGTDGLTLALQAVAQAADQAQADITRLVDLLGPELPGDPSATLTLVDELVSRARATGLQVSCELAGTFDDLSAQASQAAFRVVQESLTNALKHAPGAPVTIAVSRGGGQLTVRISNSPPSKPPSGLESAGGQFGLAAMRDRVLACGGSLEAGPNPAGGWLVQALLPARLG